MPEIIEFWRKCPIAAPPFLHPLDLPVLESHAADLLALRPADFRQFVASSRFGDRTDHRFHFSLLPIPYQGDLRRADIFLLQLNPGFDLTGYYAEWNVPALRRRLERNLRQELDGLEFPFLALDPEFSWSSGFRWWERKLREVAAKVAEHKYGGRYVDALRELAQRIAVIELVPYHSIAFDDHRLIRLLPSTAQAIAHVNESLLNRASADEVLIVVMRKAKVWRLADSQKRGVVEYPPSQARSSSLGLDTDGGKAISKRLGLDVVRPRRRA